MVQQNIYEGGQRKPVIDAGTLANPNLGFISGTDAIQMLMQALSGATAQGGTPIPLDNPMASPVGDAMSAPPLRPPLMAPLQSAPSNEPPLWPDLLSAIQQYAGEEAGGAGDAISNTLGQAANAFGPALSSEFETWTNPDKAANWPLQRSPQQTAGQNIAAGTGNSLINLPQSMWHTYQQMIGQPFAGVAGPAIEGAAGAVGDTWNWLTTPEDQFAADKAAEGAAGAPPQPSFTPGLPGQSTVGKIQGVENSTGNSAAKNSNSSAMGNGQFIKSTWLQFMNEVHPQMLDYMSKEEALQLRADPKISEQATSWYAGKAVDELDKYDLPATDENIYLHHFLGPAGMKAVLLAPPNTPISTVLNKEQISANPTILGGARTAGDIIDWARTKMGQAPISTGALPSAGPAPVPRPQMPMPDFTVANNWFDQAAPQGVDPAMLQNNQLAMMLEGIGAGLGSVDASREGGGRLFGSLAAGAGAGAAASQKLALDFERQLSADKASYATARGNMQIQQDSAKAGVTGTNLETDWMNATDQNTYEKGKSDLEVSNSQIERQTLLQAGAAERAASVPKILETSKDGIWIQTPDQGVTFIGNDKTDLFSQMEQIGKSFGMDSNMFRQQKYAMMSQDPTTNLLSMEMEIIRDVVRDGLGPSIWGEAYSEAAAVAEQQIPGTLMADPEAHQEALEKTLMGLLLGASQQASDYNWIIEAAKLGHPGAAMLVQGGQMKAPE